VTTSPTGSTGHSRGRGRRRSIRVRAGCRRSRDDDTDDHLDDDSARDQRSETDDAADGDSLFEEDFGSALQDIEASEPAAVGDDGDAAADLEGFDDLDFVLGSDEPDFDEELDSELPRIDLGIDGLDQMIRGGVPERSLLVAMGGAGTGKTTFGLSLLPMPSSGTNGPYLLR